MCKSDNLGNYQMSSLFSQTRFTSIHFFKARIFNQLSQLHYDTENFARFTFTSARFRYEYKIVGKLRDLWLNNFSFGYFVKTILSSRFYLSSAQTVLISVCVSIRKFYLSLLYLVTTKEYCSSQKKISRKTLINNEKEKT